MSSLYQINSEILRLQEACEWDDSREAYIDVDTGEIMTDEEYQKLFQELKMDQREIYEWMVKAYLNDLSEAQALKAEEERLKVKRARKEKRAERFKQIIELAYPEDEGFGVADLKWRETPIVLFDESEKSVRTIATYLEDNGLSDGVVTYPAPKLNKNELKKMLKAGTVIPGVKLSKSRKATLK